MEFVVKQSVLAKIVEVLPISVSKEDGKIKKWAFCSLNQWWWASCLIICTMREFSANGKEDGKYSRALDILRLIENASPVWHTFREHTWERDRKLSHFYPGRLSCQIPWMLKPARSFPKAWVIYQTDRKLCAFNLSLLWTRAVRVCRFHYLTSCRTVKLVHHSVQVYKWDPRQVILFPWLNVCTQPDLDKILCICYLLLCFTYPFMCLENRFADFNHGSLAISFRFLI